MHRRESPNVPWGKILGWLTPIVLIIIVIIARSNAVDEGERRNRAMSRTIVTSAPATTDCNRDFVGLDSSVEDAIARSYEINFAAIEESTSPEEFASKRPDTSRAVAQVWRDTAANARGVPKGLLESLADVWETSATIPIEDAAAQEASLRSIADVYLDLADEFDNCESTNSFASELRQEGLALRQLANEAN